MPWVSRAAALLSLLLLLLTTQLPLCRRLLPMPLLRRLVATYLVACRRLISWRQSAWISSILVWRTFLRATSLFVFPSEMHALRP